VFGHLYSLIRKEDEQRQERKGWRGVGREKLLDAAQRRRCLGLRLDEEITDERPRAAANAEAAAEAIRRDLHSAGSAAEDLPAPVGNHLDPATGGLSGELPVVQLGREPDFGSGIGPEAQRSGGTRGLLAGNRQLVKEQASTAELLREQYAKEEAALKPWERCVDKKTWSSGLRSMGNALGEVMGKLMDGRLRGEPKPPGEVPGVEVNEELPF
jgi:hypothetical protein